MISFIIYECPFLKTNYYHDKGKCTLSNSSIAYGKTGMSNPKELKVLVLTLFLLSSLKIKGFVLSKLITKLRMHRKYIGEITFGKDE